MQHKLDPWKLIANGGGIDAMQFLRALRTMWAEPPSDERSKLLLRDGLVALKDYWGSSILQRRMAHVGFPPSALVPALEHAAGERGFSTLGDRIVEATDPEVLTQVLRELGTHITQPTTAYLGGSMTLIWDSLVIRKTDDMDFVDEVPASLRSRPDVLEDIRVRYGLKIAHFQSHYLPKGWRGRVKSLGTFGVLTVMQVDPLDVLTGKLFSVRTKDFDDVRLAWPLIDREAFRQRVIDHAPSHADVPRLTEAAKRNWYILTGEDDLPHT